MRNAKRVISMILVVCMLLSVLPLSAFAVTITDKPENGTTVGQPFLAGTGGSTNFRIPGIVTLDNGTLIAACDARWNHTGDGAGLDTIVSVSTNNGASWTYTFANYLGDNGDVYNNLSTCIIDPGIGTDGTTAYLIADLWPAGIALNTSKYSPIAGENGFDDSGNLLLRVLAEDTVTIGSDGYNTMAGVVSRYTHYLDLDTLKLYAYGADGAEDTLIEGYTVDAYFNIVSDDGSVSTNLFFADSPFQPYPTDYLYLTTSTDGLNWSVPKLLNLQTEEEQSYLVGPGNGTYDSVNKNMVFTAYRHTGGASGTAYECTSLIWKDTNGNWHRSEDATTSGWSSEASAVVLDDGTVRVFYRDGYSVLRYTDYQWSDSENNYVRVATEVSTDAVKRSGCQLTSIKYSQKIDGKDAILVACPADTGSRANGYLYVFLVEEDNSMELAYAYDIVPNSVEGYAYSCISEMSNGDIALLYEGDNPDTSASAEIIFTTIDMDDVTVRDNDARLNFIDVDLYVGGTYTLKDTSGNYSEVSSYDANVATVTAVGTTATVPAATGMASGTAYALSDALYTLTAVGSSWYLHHTLSDGTEVYIDAHAGSGNGGYPNRAYTTELTFVTGTVAGTMWIKDSGGYLHLYKEKEDPYWDQCTGTGCGYKHDLMFFRPAESGETESTTFPGYVQVTSVNDLADGGQYLIAATDDAGNTYILNPVLGGASATSNDQLAKYAGEQEISSTTVTIKALAVGNTQVQIGSNVYTITVSEQPAVEIEVKANSSTSFTIDGAYTASDVSGLDANVATVELATSGDATTYAELRDSTNSGTKVELADSEYTFTAADNGTWYATISAAGSTYYVSPNSRGHSINQTALTLTFHDNGSVYLKDSSHYLYVNRSTLAWDRTGTVTGYETHITFYLYGKGEDADSAIPGYTLITSADEITSGAGYLIAFYDTNGQLYVMNPTTRTASAYNQMAAVVTTLENATTTVTVTGVAEGNTSMELAGTKYNITVRPENYDPISIPATEDVYKGTAVTITEKPANGTTVGQPFLTGTGGSTNFRIPGIVTLSDGTLIAATDARWNHTGDGAGLDTLVSVSTDNGDNWTYTFANYLGDNGNTYNNLSTCIIDPGIGTDGTTAYLIADLWPAGIALNTSKYAPVAGENGFDDNGNLLLRDLAGDTVVIGSDGYNTMAAAREYNYYLDLETYEIRTANGTLCAGFTVDEYFNISYTDAAGTTHKTNLFFADSPFQPYPTDYLYLTTSTDGLNWSEPELLNLQTEEEQSYLVGPGNGTYDTVNGNMVFTAYRHTGGASGTAYECTSLIWMDADGNWHRSEDATTSGWSSEASAVVLDDGTVRVFYRDGYSVLRYTDYKWSDSENNYVRADIEVTTTAVKKSGCQLTSIKYSQKIDGKDAILVATPANTGSRANGYLYVFLLGDDNSMELAYAYDIVPDSVEGYAYSCISEMENGNIALLYEGDYADTNGSGEIIFTTIDMDDVTARDNDARLNFVDVTVLTGKTVTETDTTGYYEDPDTSELNTEVATVTTSGSVTVSNAAQVLGSGSMIDLDSCLYTFTAFGGYYVISATAADGTTVYLDHFSTTNNNIPNVAAPGKIAVLEGTVDQMFKLQAQVAEGASGNARTLHFHAESATPYWNRCGSDTSYKCQEYLYRKANANETASTEIPGYVRITSLDEVIDGGQYLIAAKNDAGNWYVLNPTLSSTSLDHVAQIKGSTTVGQTVVTFSGVSKGYTEVLIGSTVYRVTVKESVTKDITLTADETYTDTIEGDNYANVDISGLDTSIVTVTMEGSDGTNAQGVALKSSTTLSDGKYVILNTRAQKLVNNSSATSSGATGLALSGRINSVDAGTAVWTITAVDGGYTVRDANGKYLTIGSNAASLSDEAQILTVAYANGTWTLAQNGSYLNDFGGTGTTVAGYGTVDNGSQFTIYAYGETNAEPSTTVTFTGVGEGSTTLTVERVTYNITVKPDYVAQVGDDQYATLAEAVAVADADTPVKLLRDAEGAGVVIDKDVTIDFGGYTYTFTSAVGSANTQTNGFQILKDNTVTLKNGTLKVADENASDFGMIIQNYANLTVTDMTLDGTNLDKASYSYVLSNNSGNVVIDGETNIIANDSGDGYAFDVYDYSAAGYAVPTVNVNTTGTISGKIEVSESISGNLTISGGTFTQDVSAWMAADRRMVAEDGSYTVTGDGIWTFVVTDSDGDAMYSASGADANDLFAILDQQAFFGPNIEYTLTLNYDIKIDDPIVFKWDVITGEDFDLTIDLNDHTLTNYADEVYPMIRVEGGANVTIKNGTITNDDYVFVLGASDGSFAGNLTIESGTYTGETTVASVTKGTLTINGGEFAVTESEYGATYLLNCIDANYADGSANIVVTGGTFTGFNPEKSESESGGANFVADSYTAVDNGNDTWTVKTAAAAGYVSQNTEDGTYFETVSEALAAAGSGETVQLLNDCEDDYVLVKPDVTLDLNGHTLTADYVVAFGAGDVIDSLRTGLLKVAKDNIVLDEGNAYVPVWNTVDGYTFTQLKITDNAQGMGLTMDGDVATFQFVTFFRDTNLLTDGVTDNDLSVVIRVSWTTENGTAYQNFVYNDEQVGTVVTENGGKAFKLTFSGCEGLENLTFTAMVLSETGAVFSGNTQSPA